MNDPPRILIVDDEPFNVDILEQELEELDCVTDSAASGEEALRKIEAEMPDLVLLDVMMPGLDGISVCRILKESPVTRRVPVVIVTSLDAIDDRIRGIEAGADDFLTKPVDDRELRARVRTALRQRIQTEREIATVQSARDYLANFAPEIVRRLVEEGDNAPELQATEQDISVLFADICGFTKICENSPPYAVTAMLERYFSVYMDCLHESGGDLTETTGDGMMVVIGGNGAHDHARRAVGLALSLLDATRALNELGEDSPINLHIGVNSGLATVGSTRFHGMSRTRWVYTAHGYMPTLAARVMEIAEPGAIFIGPETAQRVADYYPVADIGARSLKNITRPVHVYRVRGSRASEH